MVCCRIVALVFAMLVAPVMSATGITPTAQCTCLPNGLARDGSGHITADNKSNGKLGGTYGDSCGVQPELFSADCVHSNGTAKADAASWCTSTWCWVDPCTCKLGDVARSSYFTAELYYSYSNCGGNDTYTSTSGTPKVCTASYTPVTASACMPRMANPYPTVDCYLAGFACNCTAGRQIEVMGKCREAYVFGRKMLYPTSYGEGCGVHAEPGLSNCYDVAAGTPLPISRRSPFCDQPFSFINPCECQAGDIEASIFYPGNFYSYSICGSNDTYTTRALRSSVSSTLHCPSPAPPPAAVQSPGNLPGIKAGDSKCACVPHPASVPPIDCGTGYAQSGKCVNATSFPGFYPANYGTSCGIHMEPLSASCFDITTGRPWASPCRGDKTSGCRASWCDSAWCFVDPCCAVSDIAKSTWFPNVNLYYSYESCRGVNTFSNGSENPSAIRLDRNCTTTTTTTISQPKASTDDSRGMFCSLAAAIVASIALF